MKKELNLSSFKTFSIHGKQKFHYHQLGNESRYGIFILSAKLPCNPWPDAHATFLLPLV
jgi:hypothetical protein